MRELGDYLPLHCREAGKPNASWWWPCACGMALEAGPNAQDPVPPPDPVERLLGVLCSFRHGHAMPRAQQLRAKQQNIAISLSGDTGGEGRGLNGFVMLLTRRPPPPALSFTRSSHGIPAGSADIRVGVAGDCGGHAAWTQGFALLWGLSLSHPFKF